MLKTAISVEHLTKRYDLGVINTGTLSRDINRWWAHLRGKPDPYQKVGQPDHGNRMGNSILALDDINFQVQQGETLGIIGRNGAGKSTLLKILSRVTAPTSGKVKMNGRVGSLLEVGTGFHPELTGRENIYLNGAILGMSRKEVDHKFDEIVDFSGIEQFIDTPVKRYSSGMYVRLAFAVAAHLEPEILIVDEVLAVGDAEFQKKCLGKMSDVASEGRTVLFVSHNMGSIKQLCNKGILLESGKITYLNSISEVIDYYIGNFTIERSKGTEIKGIKTFNDDSQFIKQIELKNSKGISTNTFFMGEDISIGLKLEGMNKVKGSRIGISFNTLDGQRIFIFDTDMKSNLDIISFSRNDYGLLSISRLPLLPGNYSLDIIIANNFDRRIEIIKDAIRFNVLASDIYNNSYLLSKNYGVVFHIDANWKIENINE